MLDSSLRMHWFQKCHWRLTRTVGHGFIVAIDDRKAGTISRILTGSLTPIVALESTRLVMSTGGSCTMLQSSLLISEMIVLDSVCDEWSMLTRKIVTLKLWWVAKSLPRPRYGIIWPIPGRGSNATWGFEVSMDVLIKGRSGNCRHKAKWCGNEGAIIQKGYLVV